MNESFDSKPTRIGDLLGQYERLSVDVPEFQRGYSWEKTEVAAFWEDIQAFSSRTVKRGAHKTYFLGPIVLQRAEGQIILLDGQQRLATATILFAVIRDLAKPILAAKGATLARDIQKDLISKSDDDGTFALNLGELDRSFFRSRIQHETPAKHRAKLRSHRLIESTQQYLREIISSKLENITQEGQLKFLRGLRDTVSKDLAMVAINVDSEDDAYHIFETLNDRGLRLSVPDLVLNFLMRRCSSKKDRSKVRETWSRILEMMGTKNIDKFLRHMWVSTYGDLKARGLFHEIKSHLDDTSTGSVEFVDLCFDECEAYLQIVNHDDTALGAASPFVKGTVDYLQSMSALPLLLAGIRCLTRKNFEKLAKSTASLVVRHAVVTNRNPSELENAFFESARLLRQLHADRATDSKVLQEVNKRLGKINPNDESVKSEFSKLIVSRNQATYLLGAIAAKMQGPGALGIEDATIEHIFPQKPDPCWKNAATLEDYVWHIGNLTLLDGKRNNKIGNACYDKKRPAYKKSDIVMTQKIAKEFTSWGVPEIVKRAADLANLAIELWK
jgi:hypothetical protein